MSLIQGTLVIPVLLLMVQCKVMTRAFSLLYKERHPCNVWVIVIHKCVQYSNDSDITDCICVYLKGTIIRILVKFNDF